jgi:hypothetical protein
MADEPKKDDIGGSRSGASVAPDKVTDPGSDAIMPFGERLDEIAQDRFNRTDWIELAAAILLALATIVAAWSAYQATRWGGVQANAFSAASAARTEAAQATSIGGSLVQIDVQLWSLWLSVLNQDYQALDDPTLADAEALMISPSVTFVSDRFRDEFAPAHSAWLAQEPVPGRVLPLGTPFDMDDYVVADLVRADELNAAADAAAAEARDANQTGDNFVLVAVVMASVLFFAGVGTKFKGRGVRLMMLLLGAIAFLGGLTFMLSMPQNVGL